mmetsp:Transcript_104/g.342  ORF Transcript_104/g.342 Transcript_104/m.342 type:complete len:255 (-) Transcript_104:599-1363(-)
MHMRPWAPGPLQVVASRMQEQVTRAAPLSAPHGRQRTSAGPPPRAPTQGGPHHPSCGWRRLGPEAVAQPAYRQRHCQGKRAALAGAAEPGRRHLPLQCSRSLHSAVPPSGPWRRGEPPAALAPPQPGSTRPRSSMHPVRPQSPGQQALYRPGHREPVQGPACDPCGRRGRQPLPGLRDEQQARSHCHLALLTPQQPAQLGPLQCCSHPGPTHWAALRCKRRWNIAKTAVWSTQSLLRARLIEVVPPTSMLLGRP